MEGGGKVEIPIITGLSAADLCNIDCVNGIPPPPFHRD
jgi:hypothetical protein